MQLQMEALSVRNLLGGKLSEVTRPMMEELLALIESEIEREHSGMTRGAAAAD